jgi:hypothetical protein
MCGAAGSSKGNTALRMHIDFIISELLSIGKLLMSPRNWWLFIPAVIAVGSVYAADALHFSLFLIKGNQESAAFYILGVAIFLLIYSTVKYRDAASLFLLVLCCNFFIREMDSSELNIGSRAVTMHTKGYIYLALAVMAVWAFFIKEKLVVMFNKFITLKAALLSMLSTYIFSQAVARRLFKHIPLLPHESEIHIIMEEVVENYAHITFVMLAALLIYFHRKDRAASGTDVVIDSFSTDKTAA